jgi:HTH-type transcriptional regulator/antitoxin HigA
MARVPTKYLALIKSFPLRPIHNEQELHRAETVLHHLLDAASLTEPEQDYLLILGNLIEEYEAEAHPVEPLPPHEMLAGLIEAKGVTQTEVAHATKIPVSTISELLARKRDFNVSHVEKLCAYFGLGPSAFIHVKPELAAR